MARVGMQYIWYRKHNTVINDDGSETTTLGEAKPMGGAISMNLQVNTSDTKLYYDDGLGEYVNEFVDGTITTGLDDMEDAAEADIFGSKIEEGTEDIVDSAEDAAPWIQQIFVAVRYKRNKKQYRGYAILKVKYGSPSDEQATKGDTITFGTRTITGTIAALANGLWRRRSKWMNTLEEAKAWVDEFKAKN